MTGNFIAVEQTIQNWGRFSKNGKAVHCTFTNVWFVKVQARGNCAMKGDKNITL